MKTEVQSIESILAAAVELTSDTERQAFVERACAGDTERQRRVEELIANHFRAGSFLESPAWQAPQPPPGRASESETWPPQSWELGVGSGVMEKIPTPHSPLTTPNSQLRGVADPPTLVGYQVLELLGQGGMGAVWKAWHKALDRLVALKVMNGGEDPHRFLTEARAMARLEHPHLVPIYEVGESSGRPFFAMEYLEGGSLDKHLAGNPLPPREAAGLVETLARAVAAAHRQGVVHRD
jgi:hypothetical protein